MDDTNELGFATIGGETFQRPLPSEVERAREYATEAHAGQFRKDGVTPYIEHPGVVVRILVTFFGANADYTLPAAWLHDVVEDTQRTIKDILEAFGGQTAEMVGDLTNPEYDKKTQNRYVRKFYMRRRLASVSFAAKQIKLADRLANLRDLRSFSDEFVRVYAMESLDLIQAMANTMNAIQQRYSEDLIRDTRTLAQSLVPPPDIRSACAGPKEVIDEPK